MLQWERKVGVRSENEGAVLTEATLGTGTPAVFLLVSESIQQTL